MLTAEEIKQLKALANTEIARRNGYGSIADYAITHNFQHEPQAGQLIYADQGKAVINQILQIKDVDGLSLVDENAADGNVYSKSGTAIPDELSPSLTTLINQLKSESMTGSSTSCRGACTGLCLGSCVTGCQGCSSCTAGCGGGCTGGCRGSH